MSRLSNSPCCGSYTAEQKKLFSGFPLSTMTPHPCSICGARTLPDRHELDGWVPEPHMRAFSAICHSVELNPYLAADSAQS